MGEFLFNFQPTMYVLIAIGALFILWPRNVKKWEKEPPKRPRKWPLLILLAFGMAFVLSLTVS